uniref:Ubiquitin-like domain-containing protein n=1 Tax=Pyrodinium bahamense TaxID=73915 RepID=A0A7S0BCI5_9DINO|mmetsp:Transcript_9257/g.25944  ORF Transcript_9257/g.25944 Transcript_9257/m.25944 type:complete len:216 (+) Transcript_9257:178-825(+)
MPSVVVVVEQLNGEEIRMSTEASDTLASLKRAVASRVNVAVGAVRLLRGSELLAAPHATLSDAGIGDGCRLSLVVSQMPFGGYAFDSNVHGGLQPAGRNTEAEVNASFSQDGSAEIVVDETERTSDSEGSDYDPYESGAAFYASYGCELASCEGGYMKFRVTSTERKGRFRGTVADPMEEVVCKFVGDDGLDVLLPFAAGGLQSLCAPCGKTGKR